MKREKVVQFLASLSYGNRESAIGNGSRLYEPRFRETPFSSSAWQLFISLLRLETCQLVNLLTRQLASFINSITFSTCSLTRQPVNSSTKKSNAPYS
jgi:hypothetical protein